MLPVLTTTSTHPPTPFLCRSDSEEGLRRFSASQTNANVMFGSAGVGAEIASEAAFMGRRRISREDEEEEEEEEEGEEEEDSIEVVAANPRIIDSTTQL